MLPQDDFNLLKIINVITSDTIINFCVIKQLNLVFLHNRGIVWLQPADKEIIPPTVDIITDSKFLLKNQVFRLGLPCMVDTNKDYQYK